jgi:NADH pyrophosphatase NudC (nudix superfamily)
MRKVTHNGTTYNLTRVKAKTVLTRAPYPGRTDASVPLLYVDAQGALQYGTFWDRPDKGGLLIASRSQVKLSNARAKADYDREATTEAADAALQRVDPDQYVFVTVDPDQVATHPMANRCKGGDHCEAGHLKFIKANASRNAWCNGKGTEYKAGRQAAINLAEEDTEEEATPVITPAMVTLQRKAQRYALANKVSIQDAIAALSRNTSAA